jgi:hypothetical protein
MPKRHVLKNSNFLSADAVKNLLAKEALIRGDVEAEDEATNEGFISSVSYVFSSWKVSDSASSYHYVYRFSPAQKKDDPFGDEESLRLLYAEFAEEDRALANEGLAEFRQTMLDYDGE